MLSDGHRSARDDPVTESWFASLLHGDRIKVRRSQHKVRFLHPAGWSYFDTLRKKMHWNEGGS